MLSDRLGTARIQEAAEVIQKYPYDSGKFWIGRAEDGSAIGYRDDRHICVVSGTRGGKGTSIIINNLCLYPGSAVVIDPKGENATVTAARRGQGNEYCTGMGQDVHVLDPFTAANVDDAYCSSFNPLADLDPQNEETLEEAHRIANSIVIVRDDAKEPIWDESARTMVRGLILHVLSADEFDDNERNLIKVRELIQCGASELADRLRALVGEDKEIDSPHLLLWKSMQDNHAFGGTVARIGAQFRIMMEQSPKTLQSVLHTALTHTEFIDSPGMQRVLSGGGRTFRLSELKTNPQGMTLYLSLPLRQLRNTHYRWLRMMVDLITTQMEITRGQPASGFPLLMFLDEFKSLRRMELIEDAAAQIAGFGMKICFVVQSLAQLKETYKDGWETFLSNAGLKLFFSIEDHFSRDHISKLAGETELIREVRNFNESRAENESTAFSTSRTHTDTQSTTYGETQSTTRGVSRSRTAGTSFAQAFGLSHSESQSQTEGVSASHSSSRSFGVNETQGWSRGSSSNHSDGFSGGPNGFSSSSGSSYGRNSSRSGSHGTSSSTTDGTSEGTSSSNTSGTTDGTSRTNTHGRSLSDTNGTSTSDTYGRSTSDTRGTSDATGTSETFTTGTTRTAGSGRGETLHKRPLIQPDEVGRVFARIDDRAKPYYPGVVLAMVAGTDPLMVRRVHYFEDPLFIDCFSPHPDHPFLPASRYAVDGARPLIEKLEAAMNGTRLAIARWFIDPGQVATPGQLAATIERVPPDNRTVHIPVPYFGKVSQVAQKVLPSGAYAVPDGELFAVKNYPGITQDSGIDPLAELRAACDALARQLNPSAPRPEPIRTRRDIDMHLAVRMAALMLLTLVGTVGVIYLASNRSNQSNQSNTSSRQDIQLPKDLFRKLIKTKQPNLPEPTARRVEAAATATPQPPHLEVNSLLSRADAEWRGGDRKMATALYRQAADAGSPVAMYQLADHYFYYFDEPSTSFTWYRKAAELGNTDAICDLGIHYRARTAGFPHDEVEGVKWLRRGADLSHPTCMAFLGRAYEYGSGVPQDTAQAIVWYRRALGRIQNPDNNSLQSSVRKMAEEALNRLGVPLQ